MKLELSSPIYAIPGKFSYITQLFGSNGEWYRANNINVKGHNGIDIQAQNGQSVYAAHDGIVIRNEVDSAGGVGVRLRTTEKYDYKDNPCYFQTLYWHLEKSLKEDGEAVKRGDIIALADNTGFSTGSHLHFGCKPLDDNFNSLEPDNGYYGAIDPLPYLFYKTMEHIIIGNNQYLLYTPLKIAIAIGDPAELEALRARGLTSDPAPAPATILKGYWIIPGAEISRFKDLLNI